MFFFERGIVWIKIIAIFAPSKRQDGAIAQLVEQRTENPCVPRSIRGGTTGNQRVVVMQLSFFIYLRDDYTTISTGCVNHGVNHERNYRGRLLHA